MQNLKGKLFAILIATILTLSIGASTSLIPSARATPINIPTFAYVAANPNPAGVGQTVNIGFWLDQPTPNAAAQYGPRWGNFTIKVTDPVGNTVSLGPYTADDTGGTHTNYVPAKVGNYTIVFSFPGQVLSNVNPIPGSAVNPFVGDYYEPSTATTTLMVQQSSVPTIPETPLPTNYWSRPIISVNDNWYSISGNWLGLGVSTFANTGEYNATGNYNPYTDAPTTAHMIWTEPASAPGGQMGGEFGGTDTSNFYAPAQYEPKYAPIIMNGVIYYEMYPGSSSDPTGWTAVNLQTGQTLWTKNTTVGAALGPILRCGQILDYVSPNQYGGFTYLWATGDPFGSPTLTGQMLTVPAAKQTVENPGSFALGTTVLTGTTYSMYDAVTGQYILSIVNCTAMTLTEDSSGDLIGYFVNSSATNAYAPTLNMWNSTVAVLLSQTAQYYGATSANAWFWRPESNGIIPFALGIQWTAPLPTSLAGVPFPIAIVSLPSGQVQEPTTLAISSGCIENGVVLMTDASSLDGSFQVGYQIEAGYSLTNGQQLWIVNRTETPYTRVVIMPATAGVYGEVNLDTGVMTGYSITTGQLAWGPTNLPETDAYSSIGGYNYVSANGYCYLWGFGGTIYAVNMATGAIKWTVTTAQLVGPAGSNTPYGVWPVWTFTVGTVADGMLFLPIGHQYSPPMFRGAQQLAINCTTGALVWSNLGFDITSGPAISDGIMTVFDDYDNQIYAYGMGPSQTTVTSPSDGVSTGVPVEITGSVMDISAGSQQQAVKANFPSGLPCVSDASMSQWMQYVYQQQPQPTNTTGVQVTLTAIDPNGNTITLGTATTNILGDFGFSWMPPAVPGNYQIIATFAGTNSYYSSAASTFCTVSSGPTSSPTAAPVTGLATASDLTYGIMAAVIAIIIAIAIVGLLLLRKKP